MPINVFGNSNSNDNGKKIDTSLFVQKSNLRHNYKEANIEEDIDLKCQFRIKSLPNPISIREVASKNYVDNIIKSDIDFNDVKLENIKFVKVNCQPAVNEHLTPKVYVDTAIDEPTLVRNNKDNDFGNNSLRNINIITLNRQAQNDNQVITKAYVDQFHQEKEISLRDLRIDFHIESKDSVKNNQDNNLNAKNLTNLDSITKYRNRVSDNEVSNEKYIDDELEKKQ